MEDMDAKMSPYFLRKEELTIQQGCLMWGIKVIIPKKFQNWVLNELHLGHPGIVKMKSIARTHVWWPGIDKEIEQITHTCQSCVNTRNKLPQMTLHPWMWPEKPWQRLHIDYAGPFLGRYFLIVVDARTKWPEVIPTATITSEKTITELRKLFSTHGIPEQIVSDNGTQFTSSEKVNYSVKVSYGQMQQTSTIWS